MRQAGILSSEQQAQRLVDYLLTLGIKARADAAEGGWIIWIIDEQYLQQGRQELEAFRRQPDDPRYTEAGSAATALRREQAAKVKEYGKNVIEMRDRWGRSAAKRQPITMLLILASVATGLMTGLGSKHEGLEQKLTITQTQIDGNHVRWMPGLPEIRSGEVWRLVTPMFLHFGILHLVFNMMWLYQLSGILERRYGTWRFALFVVLIAVASNLAQYEMTQNPLFGGMSGVVYGLFGFLWIKGNMDPGSDLRLRPDVVFMMVAFFFLCMTGWVGPIANWAHGVGLAVGMVVGFLAALRRS